MSTIQPQMNTASFASLAGSPKASAGEAPQGLDFLTILAGSQLPGGAADAAVAAPQAALAQAVKPAGGNADGTAGGKILPGSTMSFAASHAHPAFTVLNRFTGEVATDAPGVERAADAMIAQDGAKVSKQAAATDGHDLSHDAGALLSIDPAVPSQPAPEAMPSPVTIPAFEVASRPVANAPQMDMDADASDRASSRTAPELFAMRTAAPARPELTSMTPVPASLAPLVAEAMAAREAKPQSATTQPRVQAASATSALAINAASGDSTAALASAEPVRVPELAPVALNRTMTAASAIPASTLIAARAGEPAKGAAPADLASPAAMTADPASVSVDLAADSDTEARPGSAPQTATIDTPATGLTWNTASMVQEPSVARPVSGTVAAQPDAVQPQDFETLVGRLTEAREAASPNLVRAAINHSEFGQISLAFRADESRMAVTMSGSDPALAPAVLAAAASAAQTAGNDSAAREQNAQNQQQNQQQSQQNGQQQAQQNQTSGQAAQSSLGNAAQGQTDRQSPDGRTPSGEGRNPARAAAGDTTSEAPAAPRSTPPGIYA